MTQRLLSSLLLSLLFTLTLSSNHDALPQTDAITLHFLPEPFRVVGKASVSLPSTQVVINLSSETKESDASTALSKNGVILNNAIAAFKVLGLIECEFATSNLSVSPNNISYYDTTTSSYQTKQDGYKVSNNLIITTKKMELAGKIIDAAVKHGVTTVNSISYSPLSSEVDAVRKTLFTSAIKDAKEQAAIVLEELNYQILSIKNINILNSNNNQNSYQTRSFAKADSASAPTSVFGSSQTVSVDIEVYFIIAPVSTKA